MRPASKRRWRARPSAPAFSPETNPMAPADYVIRAIIDGVDQCATEMERKWGIDRLRLLVPDELRARFDTQKDKLDAAIATNREAYVRAQAEGMKRAWKALDRAATEAGHAPLAPEVWECRLPESGEIVALVRTTAEAHLVARDMRTFTLPEIGRLIEALGDTVLAVKGTFPGAEVTRIGQARDRLGARRRDPVLRRSTTCAAPPDHPTQSGPNSGRRRPAPPSTPTVAVPTTTIPINGDHHGFDESGRC